MKKVLSFLKPCLLALLIIVSAHASFGTYCTPVWYYSSTHTAYLGDSVNHVQLTGSTGFINDSSNFTSGYIDLSTTIGCGLNPGSVYTMTLGNPSGTTLQNVEAWVDFNNDGVFDSTERVGGGSLTSAAHFSFRINIASGAAPGTHRMRVEIEYYYHSYPYLNPCPNSTSTSSYYGEARDYFVNITNPSVTYSPASTLFPPTVPGTCAPSDTIHFSAMFLTPVAGLLTVTAPSGYTISPTSGGTYTTSYTITYTGATANSVVYIQFCPAATITYSGCVIVTGGGLSSSSCGGVSGTGAPVCSGTPAAGSIFSNVRVACPSSSFTLTDTGHSTTAGINYQWQYSSDSIHWSNIAGATLLSFTGSESGANYYRVLATCAASGYADTSAALLVPFVSYCYCVPAFLFASSSCGTYPFSLGAVHLIGETGTSIYDTTACDGSGYRDHTAMSCYVARGTAYQCTVVTASGSYSYAMSNAMWIDFNDDGIFQATEMICGNASYSGSPATVIDSFSIPSFAPLGMHRLRIVQTYAGYISYPTINPCPTGSYPYYYGEARDYYINVIALSTCSGTPAVATAIASPTTGGSTTSFSITLSGYTVAAGITHQWQFSTDGGTTWNNIVGANGLTYSFTGITTNTCYRSVDNCAASGHSSNSSMACVSLASGSSCGGIITTIAGRDSAGYAGDGGAATAALLNNPFGICIDASNNIYVADQYNNVIRKISPAGFISTFAGTSAAGYSGDGGAATAAQLNNPTDVAIDVSGNIFIADENNHRIRKVNSSGVITTVAGNGTAGFSGDGGPATAAKLQTVGICLDASGNLYLADYPNNRIRKVNSTSGIIVTIGGSGTSGFSGDGGPATSAMISIPGDVAVDGSGNIYFTDNTSRIRRINSSGTISTIAGTGTASYTGDGGTATSATMNRPFGIIVDASGNIFFADYDNNVIRKINTSGIISTYAGNGSSGFSGDGGLATSAMLNHPANMALDAFGNMFIADQSNNNIRKVSTAPTVAAISGPSTVCVGTSGAFTDATTGGTWSSSNTAIATVSSTGAVTGVTVGSVFITYTVTTSCGSAYATQLVTVNSSYAGPAIAGPSTDCIGAYIALSDSTLGGTWSSSNTGIATVNATGAVLGVSSGTVVITYTFTGACGTAYATKTIAIGTGSVSAISGPYSVCTGTTITLTDSTAGGSWSSSNTAVATVSSAGVVAGVSSGSVTISYVTTAGSCGSGIVTRSMIVNASPTTPASITGATTVCLGASTSMSDGTTGGTWSSSAPAVATINATTGAVTGVAAGTAVISYSVSNSCGSAWTSVTMTVNPAPTTPAAISGVPSVCTGATIALSDATTGGVWSSSASGFATVSSAGVVTGVAAGTANISYTVTNSCGSTSVTKGIRVSSAGTVAAITGTTSLCSGASSTLADATSGGTWSSSNAAVASVSATGGVTGVSAGTANITYTVAGSCGSAYAVATVTVTSVPTIAAIGGATSICPSATTTLTDATTGGTWSSTNAAVASVSTSGLVTGIAAGTATISYTLTNSCGTAAATATVTVGGTPSAGSISGTTTLCGGTTTTLTDGTPGGVWTSSTPAVATISSTGVVTGVSAGTSTITYTVTTGCGTARTTTTITVNPAPNAGTVSGSSTICTGVNVTFSNTVTGGTWSSSASSIAAVTSAGVVTGVLAGTATISYSVTNGCGTAVATRSVTVQTTPAAGTVTGASTVCTGATTTLTDATSGGTWSSANTAIASVSSAGVVTGIASGTTSISYTITGACGSATAGFVISVTSVPSAGSITGAAGVCTGGTATLTDAVSGGTWSSSNTSIATVTSAGVVRGVASGTVTISYAVTSACGTAYATSAISVSTSASAGTISGLSGVCTGATITLTTSGTAGGTWSSSNAAIASISGGTVHGVSAGTVTISYSVASSCGTVVATKTVTVTTTPSVAAISGATSICAGTTSTYTDATSGGGWISSSTAIATVNSGGVVTGVSVGTVNLTYFVTNTCGTATATKSVTVNSLSAGVISGGSSIAVGASTTLTNTVSGGTWSSANTSLATVSTTGLVTGVAVGIDTIKYTVTNSCGTAVATKGISITAHRDLPSSVPTTGGDVNLYPNPSNGTFTIELPCQQCNAMAIALDMNGRILEGKTTDEKTMYFDLSGYAAGTYVVKINADGKEYTRKVVIR